MTTLPHPFLLDKRHSLALTLLARHESGDATPVTIVDLAIDIQTDPDQLTGNVHELRDLGLLTEGSDGFEPAYSLSGTGVERARWSRSLGLVAITGLNNLRLQILKLLGESVGTALYSNQLFDRVGQRFNTAELETMADQGLIVDVRAWFAPGTSQSPQWHITDRGLDLLACLEGKPAPAN